MPDWRSSSVVWDLGGFQDGPVPRAQKVTVWLLGVDKVVKKVTMWLSA